MLCENKNGQKESQAKSALNADSRNRKNRIKKNAPLQKTKRIIGILSMLTAGLIAYFWFPRIYTDRADAYKVTVVFFWFAAGMTAAAGGKSKTWTRIAAVFYTVGSVAAMAGGAVMFKRIYVLSGAFLLCAAFFLLTAVGEKGENISEITGHTTAFIAACELAAVLIILAVIGFAVNI